MEFSFDRSSKEPLQNRAQEASPVSTGPRPGPDLNSLDPASVANERLRKAIERNRAKQAARSSGMPQQEASRQEIPRQEVHQETLFSHAAQDRIPPQQTAVVEEEPVRELPKEAPKMRSTAVVSRRSVARPEDTEFVPVKRTTRKVASQISYTTNSTRKKPKSLDPKYVGYLVKGSWIFCGIMILRLIFATGGVTDYYSQRTLVEERTRELSEIKTENMQIVREIERMRSDTSFQKKLVRDNLGFIASDEFLVLFPKEK